MNQIRNNNSLMQSKLTVDTIVAQAVYLSESMSIFYISLNSSSYQSFAAITSGALTVTGSPRVWSIASIRTMYKPMLSFSLLSE